MRSFAWAWIVFFSSAALAAYGMDGPLWARLAAFVTGTTFPALLCVSALVCARRPVPGWIVPLGLGVGLVRGLAKQADLGVVVDGLALVFEPGFDLAGAAVIARSVTPGRPSARRMLAVMLIVMAGLEATLVLVDGGPPGSGVPFWLVGLGTLSALMLGLAQMLVIVERAHEREAEAERRRTRELGVLRDIARAASRAPDPRRLAEEALAALRELLALDGGVVYGLSADRQRVDLLTSFGLPDSIPAEVVQADPEFPFTRLVLGGQAVVTDDAVNDPRELHPYSREIGLRCQAYYPLRHGDATVGTIAVGRREGPPFGAADQQVLEAAAEELALALQHGIAVSRLRAEQQRLGAVIDTAPVGVLIEDVDGRVVVRNASLAHHLGLADGHAGRDVDAILAETVARAEDPQDAAEIVRQLRTPPHPAPRGAGRGRDASQASLTLVEPERRELLLFSQPVRGSDGDVVGRVLVTRDVSDERELAVKLRQSQKMETLGTLASGIAHDFNNQLTAILGNAALLVEEIGDDAQARQSLLELERAAEHCAGLTQSLLAFARQAPAAWQRLPVHELVEDVAAMMRSILPKSIHFVADPGPPDATVLGDPTQLRQVLINLLVNARDAVASDGHVELRARRGRSVLEVDGEPRPVVEIEVRDDGRGMEPAERERMFDPFFTTKPPGRGTGLGLSVVYGAVQAHGGRLEVESETGRGTTIRVLLATTEPAPAPSHARSGRAEPRRDARVLVADDEVVIRRLVRVTLERRGHRVVEAADGKEAVAALLDDPAGFDAVILDLTMPGLDGQAALQRMRTERPRLPAVLMSGLLGAGTPGEAPDEVVLLPKPFSADSLLEALDDALARGG